ncbi:MAG TPA: MarC family protein [Verrucomicrobiae bacterium]|nr:MarC family protein [Verrucomicrobiae bacterium]
MDFNVITWELVIDIFLLLLIGIGPKISLVPFLELTANMPAQTKAKVIKKMITTAGIAALLLIIFGKLLTKLLHFSTGAMGIAGGIILLIISVTMVLSKGDTESIQQHAKKDDPIKLAVFPLAVPYLLNPAGIVTLITVSAEATSNILLVVVIGILAAIICIDFVIFRWATRVSEHLDPSRMLITEKVFGILLAALSVQLMLDGLSEVGVIHLIAH